MQELAATSAVKPQPVPIDHPPVVAPALTAQEQAVLNGSVREKLIHASTVAGAIGGTVGGLIMGGIWALAGKGNPVNHWGRKVFGTAALVGFFGGLISRSTWGKDVADRTVSYMSDQVLQSNSTTDKQAEVMQAITQAPSPETAILGDTITHQSPAALDKPIEL
jgi:hypothetical protein